jgi:glycosyltransferase involved in cell wall biosynthesis
MDQRGQDIKMKILIRQFFGAKLHSWFFVGLGLANALIKHGHQVDIYSTDGVRYFPTSLQPHLLGYYDEATKQRHGRQPTEQYDMQFSYTLPTNFPRYLSSGIKNRFGMWTYEWISRNGKGSLPTGLAKHFKSCDLILAPSNYSKEIFINSGVPETSIRVMPHGVSESFVSNETISLPTTKRFKLLANIAQNHIRKNIPDLLQAYGKAFIKQDDVCLILQGRPKRSVAAIEIDLNKCLAVFEKQFPNHAEIKLHDTYIENIATLYNSIDAVFTMSHCEGFWMVGLEALASGKISIAPNHGGQRDFLNADNALLIDGKEERADPKSMYWMMNETRPNALWFQPSIDDAVNKLHYAYENYTVLNAKLEANKHTIQQQYSWNTIATQITDLCI